MSRKGWLKAAERLEKVAESLRKRAAPKLDPGCAHQNLTARRASMAAGMVAEGRRLEELASAAEFLAAEHRNDGSGPPKLLSRIRTAKDLETVRLWGRQGYDSKVQIPRADGGYAADRGRLAKLGILTDSDLEAASALLEARAERRGPTREERIRELERELLGVPIPGFFPTPEPVGRQMAELAKVSEGDLVLEPSAGKGDLIELALERGAAVHAVEVSSTLLGLLRARFEDQDVEIEPGDFLELKPWPIFDAVLMNPPFERGQDADHVRRALEWLRPGGRLVAIVSEGLFFRSDRRAVEFREFLAGFPAGMIWVEKLERGAFTGAEAYRQTGVAARLVVIQRNLSEKG